ncbi:BQ2448_6826 [Microbotryum intermedium]|uniref:BQ2448_6826 protein n=1 Tax=Microbotryum intermedium TaxID=269621 RepID=A0A238FR91_9BASI|nr:BQ2448_6826 [Microbotryum intermedium]
MDEDAVQAEIARLSNAIAQHKAHVAATGEAPIYPATLNYGRESFRGRGATRGRGPRGWARGATSGHRNATWVAPTLAATSTSTSTSAAVTTPSSSIAPLTTARPAVPVGGFRNKTLVLNRDKSLSAPSTSTLTTTIKTESASTTPQASTSTSTTLASTATPTNPPRHAPMKEVLIDGVKFITDARAHKLIRKTSANTTPTVASLDTTSDPTKALTPRRTSVSGTTYIRTKNGNLISLDVARKRKELSDKKDFDAKKARLDRLVGIVNDVQSWRNGSGATRTRGSKRGGRGGAKRFVAISYAIRVFVIRELMLSVLYSTSTRPKSMKLCRFFQKTGQCTNGLRCRYIHDSHRVSICPNFLRSKCPLPSSTCALSHEPNAHRSPHCIHHPHCTRRPNCPFSHIDALPPLSESTICRPFVEYGWCELGEKCRSRHANECPRFSETGVCEEKGCRLPHVLRRRNDAKSADRAKKKDEAGGDDLGIDWNAGPEWTVGEKRKAEGQREETEVEVRGEKRRKAGLTFERNELAQNQDYVRLEVELDDSTDHDEDDDDEEEEEEEGDEEEEDEDVSSGDEEHPNEEAIDLDEAEAEDEDGDEEEEADEVEKDLLGGATDGNDDSYAGDMMSWIAHGADAGFDHGYEF